MCRGVKTKNKLLGFLAFYPVTFYIGIIIAGSVIFFSILHFSFGWEFSYGKIIEAIKANQTILVLIFGIVLSSTLIASAIAYKQICNLSRQEYLIWLQQRSTRTLFPIFTPLHDWFRLRITIYNWWHTKVYSSTIHTIVLVVVVISLANSIVFQRNTLISQSSELDSSAGADTPLVTDDGDAVAQPTGGAGIVPIGPNPTPAPPPVEVVPVPDEPIIKPKVTAYRIYIDNNSRQTGEKWRVSIAGVDGNGNVVTSDSTTEVAIQSTNVPISFYTSNSYNNRTERYRLSSGTVTAYAIANEAGTTRIKIIDGTGIIAYSVYFSITAPIVNEEKVETPVDPPPLTNDITDDVVTRRVNASPEAEPVSEVGSIELLNEQPEVKRTAEVTAAAGSALALSAVSPLGTVLSNFFVQALVNGVSLFNLSFIGISRRIRRRGRLGVVINSESGLPIPGVFVELRDEYGKFVAKMMTDKSGSFGFISGHSGKFLLRIGNPLYLPYQSKLFIINDPQSQVVSERIALQPISQAHTDRLKSIVQLFRFRRVVGVIDWPLLILGTIFAIALVYHNPTTGRYLLAIFYAILWVAKAIDLSRDKTSGVILDSTSRQPVGLAVVQLCAITPNGTQVIRSAVTDNSGRFLFAVAKGNYQLVVARQGYQTIDKKIRGEDTSLEIALAPA